MKTYTVLKDGQVKITGRGEVLADGTVRINGQPIALRAECAARGFDPVKVQKQAAPSECLARLGMNAGAVEILTEDELSARRSAELAQAEALLESQVPGVAAMRELERAATNELDRYSRQFARMMEDENNDGARPPKPVNKTLGERLADMRAEYPRAALYLKAERQAQGTSSYSATSGAMKGGTDAMKILRDGGTVEEAEKALAFRYESNDWN